MIDILKEIKQKWVNQIYKIVDRFYSIELVWRDSKISNIIIN